MFTIDQIKQAHSKVNSGADFPNYIREIATLGVLGYYTYVSDGHGVYLGEQSYSLTSDSKYESISIVKKTNKEVFIADLKLHQQGETNYMQFCEDCAKSGIEKWYVNIKEKTCTYFDFLGNEVLVEKIPI